MSSPTRADLGARGELPARGCATGPLAIAAFVLITLAVGASVALFPHRVERPLGGRLRAVRTWNMLESRCQLENDSADPLAYSCGSYIFHDVHRTPDATTRPLVAIRSPHDNCVVDEDTLEPVLCRDRMFEWVAYSATTVSVAVLATDGTHQVIVQKDLASGELRSLDVSFDRWFVRNDPREVFVRADGDRLYRIGFGELIPIDPD